MGSIVAVVDDLLVSSRIAEAAKRIGVRIETVSSAKEAITLMTGDGTELIVVDLGVEGLDLNVIAEVAQKRRGVVVAFYPHVDVELRRAARRAGIEHVYPRSRFLRETVGILGKALGERSVDSA